MLGVGLGGLGAFLVAKASERIYEATVLLAPAEENAGSGLASLSSQLGGVGFLLDAGVTGGASLQDRALATLKSRGFSARFIDENGLLPILFSDRWDAAAGEWQSGTSVPSLDDGVEIMERRLRKVSVDRQTGITTLAIRWADRQLAADWANAMIDSLNLVLRESAVAEFNRNIDYLNRQMENTSVVAVRESLSNLLEEQIKSAMIANVSSEYAFRILDRAVPPDPKRPIRPRTALLTAVGLLLGGLLGLGMVWVRQMSKPSSTAPG